MCWSHAYSTVIQLHTYIHLKRNIQYNNNIYNIYSFSDMCMYVYVTESLCCMHETKAISYINYTSTEKWDKIEVYVQYHQMPLWPPRIMGHMEGWQFFFRLELSIGVIYLCRWQTSQRTQPFWDGESSTSSNGILFGLKLLKNKLRHKLTQISIWWKLWRGGGHRQ